MTKHQHFEAYTHEAARSHSTLAFSQRQDLPFPKAWQCDQDVATPACNSLHLCASDFNTGSLTPDNTMYRRVPAYCRGPPLTCFDAGHSKFTTSGPFDAPCHSIPTHFSPVPIDTAACCAGTPNPHNAFHSTRRTAQQAALPWPAGLVSQAQIAAAGCPKRTQFYSERPA